MENNNATLESAQLDKKFLKEIKKRKNDLIKKYILEKQDITTKYTHKGHHLLRYIRTLSTELQSTQSTSKGLHLNLDNNDVKTCSVEIREDNKLTIHQKYICMQYYDIYEDEANQINRYIFFEIYFSGDILSVLMKKSIFDNSQVGFSQFDMNRKEWAEAKLQMKLWCSVVPIKVKHMHQRLLVHKILNKYFGELEAKKKKQIKKGLKTELKNEDIASVAKVWPLLSYIGYAQLWTILGKETRKLPLLNIACSDLDDTFEKLISNAVIDFCFHKPEITITDIPIVYGAVLPKRIAFQNLPVIFVLKQPSKSNLEKLEKDVFTRMSNIEPVGFSTEELPIIIQKEPVYVDGVLNLELDRSSVLNYVKNKDLKQHLKTIVAASLASIIKELDKDALMLTDLKAWIKSIGKNISKTFGKKLSTTRDWWNEQSIVLLPEQYMVLAAWFDVMLPNEQLHKEVYTWLNQKERDLQNVNNVLQLLAEKMLRLGLDDEGQPVLSGKEDTVTKPFLKESGDEDGTCIVFTPNAFQSFLQSLDNVKDADPKELREIAYHKKLLHTNKGKKDWVIKFKVEPSADSKPQSEKPQKSSDTTHPIRCFAFCKNKLKSYLEDGYKQSNQE